MTVDHFMSKSPLVEHIANLVAVYMSLCSLQLHPVYANLLSFLSFPYLVAVIGIPACSHLIRISLSRVSL